jgi:hypothetical protein
MTDCTGGRAANTKGQEDMPKDRHSMTDCTGGRAANTKGQEGMPKVGTA